MQFKKFVALLPLLQPATAAILSQVGSPEEGALDLFPRAPETSLSPVKSNGLIPAPMPTLPSEMHAEILGTLFAVVIWGTELVQKGLKPFVNMYALVSTTWNAYDKCNDWHISWQSKVDCLFAAMDALGASLVNGYYISQLFGLNKRTTPDGLPDYGNSTISRWDDGTHVYSVSHIPHEGSLSHASVKRWSGTHAANHTWEHHASVYVNGERVMHLYHRLAHPEDLGVPNSGKIHQYRVQAPSVPHPSPESSTALARKRALKKRNMTNAGPLVADLVWEHNDSKDTFSLYKGAGNALGDKWAEKMEYHNWEATCASPGFCEQMYGTRGCSTSMNAMVAYGWNEASFNFNGRGQGWLDSCGTACSGNGCPALTCPCY